MICRLGDVTPVYLLLYIYTYCSMRMSCILPAVYMHRLFFPPSYALSSLFGPFLGSAAALRLGWVRGRIRSYRHAASFKS